MKKILSLAALIVVAGSAQSQTLWYGGDFDGQNGLSAEIDGMGGIIPQSFVYDGFNVGAGGATVTGLFGNYLINDLSNSAKYEIRSGMSAGNGGTLIASGSLSSLTWTNTGQSGFGFSLQKLSGSIAPLNLSQGSYYMALSVEGSTGRAFLATTSGSNGVGTPLANGDSYFDSAYFGGNFQNASDFGGGRDYSYGVTTGGSTEAVPEPFTMGLLGMGALAARRKLKSQAK